MNFWQSVAQFFGLDNLSGPQYGFWSGVGGDIGELAILGGVLGVYRKHNCHVDGCPRIGKHAVDGTPYVVCAKHHPEVPEKVTHGHVVLARAKALTGMSRTHTADSGSDTPHGDQSPPG